MISELIHETPTARRCNLILHCGADAVARQALEVVKTPDPTSTWHPISHLHLISVVETALKAAGLHIVEQAHALTHDQNRYFGLYQVTNGKDNAEFGWVVGVRNSHDKSFPAGIVAGTQILVCDNLSFCGEIKLSRKHTSRICQDLPVLAENAVARLRNNWSVQSNRISAYKDREINDVEAHDLVVRSLDAEVIPARKVPVVLTHWREPQFAEFEDRTVWSLHNAFTEALKGNMRLLPGRTVALQRLLDDKTGFAGYN